MGQADFSWLLLVYGVLQSVHIGLAAVQCSPRDVHTHGVDTHVVWGETKSTGNELEIKHKSYKKW